MGNPTVNTPDPIEETLNAINAPKSVKADLWDAYYNSRNADELADKIKPVLIDKVIKAKLWDMKENEASVSPAAYGPPQEKPSGLPAIEDWAQRGGGAVLDFVKGQIPKTPGEFAEGVLAPPASAQRQVLDLYRTAKTARDEGVGAAASQLAEQTIPFPVAKVAQHIGAREYPEAVGTAVAGAGQLYAASKIGGAAGKPKAAPPEPSVAYEQMGLGLQQVARAVDTSIRQEVGAHAQNIEKVMGERYPNGVIDKSPYLPLLNKTIDKYYDTMTRVGLKVPSDLKQFVEEIRNTPSDKLTWNQAKDLRSSLQDMRQMTDSRAFAAALKPEIDKLTLDMANTAKNEGLGTDWEAYNTVHSRGRRLGEAVLDKVIDAKTGKDALNALKSQEGAVKMALPDLKAYGLNPNEFREALDSYKPKADEKAQVGLLKHWWSRHAAGAIASAAGGSFMLGYGPVVAYQALSEGARTPKIDLTSPVMNIGAKAAEARRIPGPTPVAKPVPLPEAPPTPQRVLPPAPPRQAPKEVSVEATPVETPEPPQPSKYTEAQKAANDIARKGVILKQIKAGKPLTDAQWQWLEQYTDLDLTKPENVSKAIEILKGKKEK